MRILLDTCAFLWILNGSDQLSDTARSVFTRADNQVYLSVVSIWEISLKYSLGKLPLPQTPATYLPEKRRAHGILSLDLVEATALQLPRLPQIHRDPFDRMLICQAIILDMVLLTPDEAIRQYPVRTSW